MRTRVKICCIADEEEAALAIAHGADAIGLVGEMPSGPGCISDSEIAKIAGSTPPPISTFLLSSETTSAGIIAHQKRTGANTIQIVDRLSAGTYEEIRSALPSVKVVQVIHVLGDASVEEANHVSQFVDAILLDSGNPNAEIKTLGGTGNTHDWALSRQIRDQVSIPVFLAGGLRSSNVRDAIQAVNPFGVDVCSGVRTDGKLDPEKLRRFIVAVNG